MAATPAADTQQVQDRRCSTVCGITPSSAATAEQREIDPHTPASMLWMKRSWPGTSTKRISGSSRERPIGEAEVDGDAARLFLGQADSVSTPGQRLHQARVLPWSMCLAGGDDHPGMR